MSACFLFSHLLLRFALVTELRAPSAALWPRVDELGPSRSPRTRTGELEPPRRPPQVRPSSISFTCSSDARPTWDDSVR